MEMSRTENSKRNIVSGVMKQIMNVLLTFIIRSVILYILGAEYQGLNGLFTSILQVLNLTDLGFTGAVVYILYRPIAENDVKSICAIMAYLKSVYFKIGIAIFSIGLLITPFLPKLIRGSYPSNTNIYILFLIYLFNASISYLMFAYKSALLTAMQREDIVSNIYTITSTSVKILQIVLLLIFRNYYCYIIVMPLAMITNNILIQREATRLFPGIIPNGQISKEVKSEVIKQVKALFIDKIGQATRNSMDNIILSTFLGLTVVAIYDNYYYIHSAIYGMMLVINNALQASVGNSIVKESVEKNYHDLSTFTFVMMWMVGVCTISMLCLYQPFMEIWMHGNEKMLFSTLDMCLMCLYFYIINMNNTRNLYINANGLFWKCRRYYVMEAIGNLLLNVFLGKIMGITGVILATIITIFIFNFIARSSVLFKQYFIGYQKDFYKEHLSFLCVTCLAGWGTYIICEKLPGTGIEALLLRTMVCTILPNMIFWICFCRSNEFINTVSFLKRTFSYRKKR